MATAELSFSYQTQSRIHHKPSFSELVLSHHTEIEEIADIPCFFWGNMTDSLITAKALLCVSKVVRSNFAPTPTRLLDPIVTTGQEQIRFEGFSSCNGIYARLDLLSDGVEGEFIASGTTNVDFNEPMLNALNGIKKSDFMLLGVGSKEVSIAVGGEKITEKKVKLPERWVKGLTSVQVYLSDMTERFVLNKIQVVQFFSSLPKGKNIAKMYLNYRAGRYQISPIAMPNSVVIDGIERLRLLEMLVPYIEKMVIYQADNHESCAVQIYLPHMRLTLALSPQNTRGFSGEGNILERMSANLPMEWVYAFNHLLKSNEMFNPTLLSIEHQIDFQDTDHLTATLSAMGLLGFDLHQNQHYYRRLPFKMDKILALNPRLKNAKKLIASDNIQLLQNTPNVVEAQVKGSQMTHTVMIKQGEAKCTCQWYAKHQTSRGLCKHILAVKMLINQ